MPDDEDDDPFADFEAPEDDPFEDLEGPADDTDGDDFDAVDPDSTAESPPGRLPDDPFDRESAADPGDPGAVGERPEDGTDRDGETAAGAAGPDADPADAEPTDDPFASFSTPRQGEGDDDPFCAFESAGVEEIDHDAVWEDLQNRDGSEPEDRVYSEVSKHRFCERCEHFSGPPEVRCTYDGAAIVEFLDVETVRLLNCPIVAEQRALEERGTELGGE
ncbi:hypothetical protein [Halorientalis halophila]|uniref:hypothetical protein n=1 Tax=Halorientalis halophila TaxID=3108499 RepID=UPI00300BB0BB